MIARPCGIWPYPHCFFITLIISTMKRILFSAAVVSAMFVMSCGNNAASNETHEGHGHASGVADTANHASADAEKQIPVVAVKFTNTDSKVSTAIRAMVDGYIEVKNALVAGNAADAAKASDRITTAIKGLDKSLLTAEQKAAYDGIEAGLAKSAGAISGAAKDLAAQRSQFYPLSQAMYELVKSFGGGRALYHDHCPMARDNQGALWLSETKDVKNPYFGDEMLTCGTVEEVIQ